MANQGKYSLPALYLYVACMLFLFSWKANSLTETEALLKWKESFENQSIFESWVIPAQSNSTTASPCRWRGISCDDAGTLDLKTNKLSGSVPRTIGLLSKLQFLDLSTNDLNGTLPLSLANLTQVYELDISRNSLVGEIDARLFPDGTGQSRTGLIGLKNFLLQDNQLGGRIPEEIGNSKLLTLIALDGNFLTGPIPAYLGNLSSLSILRVAENQLTGQIPTNIGTLNNLTDVRLFSNNFTGLVPEELGNLSSLTVLHLAENNFSGHLPQEVCRGGKLVNFSASFNSFTGPVPVSLRDCQSLYRVRLEHNQLTGILDRDFGVYPNLTYMDLSYNKLQGELSPKWGECQQLTLLKIAVNSIDGRIPDEITSLSQLVELDLSSNQLSGEIPKQIGDLTRLSFLSLKDNNISAARELLGQTSKPVMNSKSSKPVMNRIENVVYELNKEGFPQLKYLHVQNALETRYIINSIGWGLCNVFPKLESLNLLNLISLEKICYGKLATVSFSQLRIMKIRKCDRLKHLLTFSMAKNLLQLREIEVTDCKKLEEIVFQESEELQFNQTERISTIEFTQLRTLRLKCLPLLTSFGFNPVTPDAGSLEIVAEDEPVGGFMLPFSQNVLLPRLEMLELSSVNIECMWLDQLPIICSCCRTLTSLTLKECSGNLKYLFSYSVIQSLVELQKLEIHNCKSIEEIINTEELRGEETISMMVFPKLINLQLKGLPKLTRFGYSGNSVEIPSLTQLFIKDCPNLKTFFSTSTSEDTHPLFGEKVVLPTLKSLNVSSIGIQTIWHNQFEAICSCFQNLTKLTVDGCDTLKYVFSSSMVESLIQLEVLEISNCKFMERVIITEGAERTCITQFSKLHELHLIHLPELTSFCNIVGNLIELPSLAHLWIANCPKMHKFVSNSPCVDIPTSKDEQMNSEGPANLVRDASCWQREHEWWQDTAVVTKWLSGVSPLRICLLSFYS
ncbi:hypothetical protein EZV62_005585 [Acer yangbiense]|uniref:Uncharacterized protein n=1 Tax=Acer yangbiense TaxID=1000413 RepID=A0A5C7IN50_9ROSI|nr:hypothetical protein EZV62_005585 [Acer yangbiense]